MHHIKGNILEHLDILPTQMFFDLVEENGIYSVYHYLEGSYGQRNFGSDKKQAEAYFKKQALQAATYRSLIMKRCRLLHRIAPLSSKIQVANQQLNAMILG